jgi:hypothetical protein
MLLNIRSEYERMRCSRIKHHNCRRVVDKKHTNDNIRSFLGFFYNDMVDDDRYPFCSLTAVETDHRKRVMGRRLGQCLAMVRVVSGEALALRMAPAVVVVTGGPPPSNDTAGKSSVRQVIGMSLGGNDS